MQPRPGALTFRTTTGEPRLASESLAALVAGEHFALDVQALIPRVLSYPPNHAGETPYANVVCSERETSATARDTGQAPVFAEQARSARTPLEAAGVLRRALVDALARALVGVRRVAVLTGGGLDSAALLGLAVSWARETGGSAIGVAIDYEAEGDDRPHLRALEAHLGCEILRMAPEQAAHALHLFRGVDAAPFTWPTAAMEVELMRKGRDAGAECALTGVGGDQLFDGDPRSLASRARRGDVLGAVRAARRLAGFERPRSPVVSWVARPLLGSVLPRRVRRHLVRQAGTEAPRWAGPALVDWLGRQDAWAHAEAYASEARARAAADRSKRLDHEYLVWIRHQESVASRLPRLDPYLDPIVIGTVQAIRPDWLLHDGQRRGLFREALRGHLPESLRTRQDKAAFEPAIERFVGAARGFDVMRTWGSGLHLGALGIVNPARFREAFEQFASAAPRAAEGWVTLWPALCAEGFLVGHQENRAS